jgi:hypothetical protein
MTTQYIRTEDGKFQCPHCPKICDKQNTMYYHMKKTHLQDFKFVCEKCTEHRGFVQKSAYLQHVALAHPEDADEEVSKENPNPYVGVSFKCPHEGCDHAAKTKANMFVHYARTHCKDIVPAYAKTEACKCCEKTFASSTAYFYHAVACFSIDVKAC